MAAAAPPPGLLESISKCGRCKSRAIQPMVLSCLHSRCRECVTALLKDGVIICPQCKKTVTVRGENAFLEILSQIFAPAQATPKCEICEARGIERNATQVCLRCPPPNHFCDECTGLHTLFLPDKIHRLVTRSDFMESGGVHPRDFPVTKCACCSKSKPEVSCRGCMQSLCLKCGVARSCTKGGKHDIEDESAIVERHRQDIRQEMNKFTQNSDSISEQIEETEALLKKTEGDNKRSVNTLKQHHSRLQEEMRNQEELLQELCQSSVVEIIKVLSQMTEARYANIRGAKAGQRALDFSPDDLIGAALADVKALPRPPPPTHHPLKTSVVFEVPVAAEVSDLWKRVMGSISCNKICKSWPTMSQPYVRRHTVMLPSGRGAVLELTDEEGFYRVSARNQISVFGRGTKETFCSDRQEVPGLSLDLVPSDKAAQQKSAEPTSTALENVGLQHGAVKPLVPPVKVLPSVNSADVPGLFGDLVPWLNRSAVDPLEKDRGKDTSPAFVPLIQSKPAPTAKTLAERLNEEFGSGRPIFSEARKTYDREFLLSLQFKGRSMQKPKGLSNFPDVVLNTPIDRKQLVATNTRMMTNNFPTAPNYVRGIDRGITAEKMVDQSGEQPALNVSHGRGHHPTQLRHGTQGLFDTIFNSGQNRRQTAQANSFTPQIPPFQEDSGVSSHFGSHLYFPPPSPVVRTTGLVKQATDMSPASLPPPVGGHAYVRRPPAPRRIRQTNTEKGGKLDIPSYEQ